MLIEKEQLNIEEFKKFFNKMEWIRYPRKLGVNHVDYFYVGIYEDSGIIVKASIRPSLRMQLFESFKGRTLDGEIPAPDYKGKTCEWGSSVTVNVDGSFFEKVKSVSKEPTPTKTQTLSW